MSGPALVAALVFLALAPAGGPMIRALQAMHLTKRIRSDVPATHQVKAGTPTMGGVIFVAAAIVGGVTLALLGYSEVIWPVVATVVFAGVGAFDDLKGLRDRAGVGWLARVKFPWQWILAIAVSAGMVLTDAIPPLWLPFTDTTLDLGLWAVPLGAFLIVGWVNAVNLADGLDGLAAGESVIVVFALTYIMVDAGQQALGYWAMALAGGLLAFLWHNVRPARVFMGDIGAEALGAALAVLGLASGHMLLLLVAGLPLLSEAVSVMIQVAFFKYTRRRFGEGRRVFRMAPLHHHYEQLGYEEILVTERFWLATVIACLLALALRGVR